MGEAFDERREAGPANEAGDGAAPIAKSSVTDDETMVPAPSDNGKGQLLAEADQRPV